MAALTEGQRAVLRGRLEEERQRLSGDAESERAQFVDASQEYDEQFSSSGNHPADTGTEMFDQEHHLAIATMMQVTVEQVDHALRRMDEGVYGVCEVCGKEIPLERLEALPHATLCVEDQARQDPRTDHRETTIEGMNPV